MNVSSAGPGSADRDLSTLRPDSLPSRPGRTAYRKSQLGGYMRRLRGSRSHCAMRVGRIHPHRHHHVRDPVVELGQGLDLALLVAGCYEQTSGGFGLTPSRLRAFQLLHHQREETGGHLRYPRAKHPEMTSGGVHRVQAVSSRVTPSRRQAVQILSRPRDLLQHPKRKGPLPPEEGLDLRKLVAGAGWNCPLPNDLARPDALSWSWAIFNGRCPRAGSGVSVERRSGRWRLSLKIARIGVLPAFG